MSTHRACCCSCSISDCLFGDTVDTGCCHGCDDLLLWCNRPAFSVTQQQTSGNIIGTKCQWNYTRSQPALPPVQAIYRYKGDRWRANYPPTTPESFYELPPKCPPDWNDGAKCEPASMYACDCSGVFNPICLCNQSWLTPWRKFKLLGDTASKWLVEATCFKNGTALSGTVPSLYNGFICVVNREHWWCIPEDECHPLGYLRVPGCAGGDCDGVQEGGCGDAEYNPSALVPKWWIYGCSGVPIFGFDLDNAVADGTISGTERTAFLTAAGLKNQPPQGVLRKLAAGGYLQTRDWREQQRQDFIDLDARFPGAGYAACIQPAASMPQLGAIRKRLTAPYANPPTVVPWLNRDDCDTTQLPLNVSAGCFIDYPGAAGNQADYDFWAARQWVYFRAVPGGWTWVGWDAQNAPACAGQGFTEEEAILHGCGRADMTCIEALKGNPRPLPCCTDNAPICDTTQFTRCFACGDPPPSCVCGEAPVVGCTTFSPIPVATQCSNLVISPDCLGVRFAYAQYVAESKLTAQPGETPPCLQEIKYRCQYVALSYLVEARRSADSWNLSVPWKCRAETPKLPVFNAWKAISQGHWGIKPMCDSIVNEDGNYSEDDLCCSAYCWSYEYPEGQAVPCLRIGTEKKCLGTNDCPPHSSTRQLNCIGFTPTCS